MLLVPDQLRSGVSKPHVTSRDPKDLRGMGEHYGVAVLRRGALAARQAQGRGGRANRPALDCRTHAQQTFFSLAELNERIAELLEDLNNRVMRRYARPGAALRGVGPAGAAAAARATFCVGDWKNAGVNIDYHIDVEHHYYSVPFTLVHERVDARFTASTVEIFYKSRRVLRMCAATCVAGTPQPGAHAENPPRPRRVDADTHAQWAETVGPKTQS